MGRKRNPVQKKESVVMPDLWKQRIRKRKQEMESEMTRMVMEGMLAAGVPDGYRFNQMTLNFDPPARKEKTDGATVPDV